MPRRLPLILGTAEAVAVAMAAIREIGFPAKRRQSLCVGFEGERFVIVFTGERPALHAVQAHVGLKVVEVMLDRVAEDATVFLNGREWLLHGPIN